MPATDTIPARPTTLPALREYAAMASLNALLDTIQAARNLPADADLRTRLNFTRESRLAATALGRLTVHPPGRRDPTHQRKTQTSISPSQTRTTAPPSPPPPVPQSPPDITPPAAPSIPQIAPSTPGTPPPRGSPLLPTTPHSQGQNQIPNFEISNFEISNSSFLSPIPTFPLPTPAHPSPRQLSLHPPNRPPRSTRTSPAPAIATLTRASGSLRGRFSTALSATDSS